LRLKRNVGYEFCCVLTRRESERGRGQK
jgi:hypothetical protein